MNTKIVVDSSASLYTLQGVDFECVPLKIITDDAEYLDNGTMDALGMAQTLRTYKGKTSTSCPNVSDWLAAYEGADEVYAITITGTLSGSYNAAQLAAEEYQQENPGKRVFVLDSLSTGPEQRLLAEHLRDLLAEGREFDEICEEMLRYHKHTHLLFSLESLANLARNGRVKPAVAAVARMLGIRVIGQASEAGELDVLCKTRGEHGALERIVLEHNKRGSDEDLVKQLLQGMDKHYEDFFTRVRLGIWNADVNSQVILEILNTLLYSKSIPVAIFTDENPTPVFLESQKHIRDKIRAYSNKKTEKKRKGGNK